MNSEIPKFKPENVEAQAEQELSSEQKRTLGEVWNEMIIDGGRVPENIEAMTQAEIKQYLFKSIMKDIEKLSEEFGLQADSELIEKIQGTEDLEEKSALELEYIKKSHDQVDAIVQKFDNTKDKSTKWDSWPKRMRETGEFNCVGATLLGIHLLEKSGISSLFGGPVGHAINVAKLANGEWWYIDFMNGKNHIVKLEPEKTVIANVPVLKINQPNIIFKMIPLYSNSEIVSSVLGNLSALRHTAEDESTSDEDVEKKEAKEYLEKYGQNFEEVDFSLLCEFISPESTELNKTNEMQEERMRVDNIRGLEKPIQDFTKTLTEKQESRLVAEVETNKERLKNLFYEEDGSVLQDVSPELKNVLELLSNSLRGIKEKQPKIYHEAVDRIINRIETL